MTSRGTLVLAGSSDQTDASLEMTINWFGFGSFSFIVSSDGYRRLPTVYNPNLRALSRAISKETT
jgi:hypothetical protein